MAAGITYQPIQTQTLASAASSVTFNSIPQGYTDLVLVVNYSLNAGGTGAAVRLQFNGDTGSNYSQTFMYGNGGSAVSGRASNATSCDCGYMSTNGQGVSITNIQNYSNTTTYKTALSRAGVVVGEVTAYVNLWRNTSAITSMTVFAGSNYTIGSTFSLYGIASA